MDNPKGVDESFLKKGIFKDGGRWKKKFVILQGYNHFKELINAYSSILERSLGVLGGNQH